MNLGKIPKTKNRKVIPNTHDKKRRPECFFCVCVCQEDLWETLDLGVMEKTHPKRLPAKGEGLSEKGWRLPLAAKDEDEMGNS